MLESLRGSVDPIPPLLIFGARSLYEKTSGWRTHESTRHISSKSLPVSSASQSGHRCTAWSCKLCSDVSQGDDPAKFLLSLDGADVQRNAEGIAIIGDPRNDSHMLVSQLHLAMLNAHNAFVDEARLAGATNVFDEAARQLRWHYQWVVLNEFLPALVGHTLADQVLREGARAGFTLGIADLYRSSLPTLPIGTVILRFATVTN